ncbi:MAG: hypothetical protein HYU64_13100 [Armatimonadetes bacterium]|nr:hypothetical protein [Armatimonadota bacterium]
MDRCGDSLRLLLLPLGGLDVRELGFMTLAQELTQKGLIGDGFVPYVKESHFRNLPGRVYNYPDIHGSTNWIIEKLYTFHHSGFNC